MAAMTSKFNFECVIQYYTDQCKDTSHPPSWILKKSMTSQGENFSLQEAISLYVQRQNSTGSVCIYFLRKLIAELKKISLGIN